MLLSAKSTLLVGARNSSLSRAQVKEVEQELLVFHPHVCFEPVWMQTRGDKDKKTSLKDKERSDFFTKELDEALLRGEIRVAIHSAKDLPEKLPKGLCILAITRGLNPVDSLVMSKNPLPLGARVGTSSCRREAELKAWRPDITCVDIRGTIEERLSLLDQGVVEGVVIAEAALLRLHLTDRLRIFLPGKTAPLQGKLAIVAREEDEEMRALFSCIHDRGKT